MKRRCCRTQKYKIALLLVGIGLLLLFFCLPSWLFCCVLALVLIVGGLFLIQSH